MRALQITFRGMEPSEALSEHLRANYEKLGRLCDRVVSGRAVIEQGHHRQSKGRQFQVHLTVHVPGKEIVVSRDLADRDTREDACAVADQVFEAAERMLKQYAGDAFEEVRR